MLTSTVCVALSAAGLAIALLTAYRRRFLAATRIAAVALLPVGLYLTGLLTLVGKVGHAVGTWAADLVLKPSVWVGFGVLAASVVLYTAARFAGRRRRGVGRAGRRRETAVAPGAQTAGLPAGRGGAQETKAGTGAKAGKGAKAGPEAKRAGAAKSAGATGADDGLSDFREVEEILRRRGI
jgi:hypothetical protein